ncbi:HD-GYP domain-containing protein [Vibrio nomapromontoriensis]|uniref:HD-GYP domain-containing protein n=1 Tax=Vibrio nomapromontoriensis TaxID=2910246 RepID=UPI003D0FC5CD
MASIKMSVSRLQPGLHIRLPVRWNDHPFLFNTFKIKSDEQVRVIKQLGIKYVYVTPELSDTIPLPAEESISESSHLSTNEKSDEAERLWAEKQERIETLSKYRRRVSQCEKEFDRSLARIRSIMAKLRSRPELAIQESELLVEDIVDSLLSEDEVTLHLMGSKSEFEDLYFHCLNVSVLSMMIAKAKGFSGKKIKDVGMGALFHDIGKVKIPSVILRKTTPLSEPEHNYLKLHTKYGADIARAIGTLPDDVITVIEQHHELLDGSGYPLGLRGDEIDSVTQIISVANAFDGLCHHQNPSEKKIPYAALSYLYKHSKHLYNAENLNMLIKYMGVYPPGTIVKLSNDMVGLVISINSGSLLCPNVLLYDPSVPKLQAPIITLAPKELTIESVIHPEKLPEEIREYLNPRARISYYFEGNAT